MKEIKLNGAQLPATSSIEDGQQKAGEKENSTTKESTNGLFNLSYEETAPQECAKTTASLSQHDRKLTLVDLEEVMFEWPTLTEAEIRFVEIVNPLLRDFDGRKQLCYTTGHLAEDLLWWGFNGFSQRTIQRRLRSLWEKGVVTNIKLRSFDLQRYVELYYFTKVFVPLKRVFVPLAPVEQDENKKRDAWLKVTRKAMDELNGYLEPWGVRVVEKGQEADE